MAKCPVCQSRKAKRKCLVVAEGHICSLCCGETRQEDTCNGCPYYQPPQARRKYHEVPSFTPAQMDADFALQDYSSAIEGAIGALDHQTGRTMKDAIPISIYEKLLDKYYFQDQNITFTDDKIAEGFTYVDSVISSDLADIDKEILVKILAVLHFIAKRRSQGRREYLTIVEQYVGERLGPGMRAMTRLPRLR